MRENRMVRVPVKSRKISSGSDFCMFQCKFNGRVSSWNNCLRGLLIILCLLCLYPDQCLKKFWPSLLGRRRLDIGNGVCVLSFSTRVLRQTCFSSLRSRTGGEWFFSPHCGTYTALCASRLSINTGSWQAQNWETLWGSRRRRRRMRWWQKMAKWITGRSFWMTSA